MPPIVNIAGAGLAGCESALQLADLGYRVRLHEMRPAQPTPAHSGADLAQIVCSNSLKSIDPATASGLLKSELDLLGCRLLEIARTCAVPAGAALAVDRKRFSEAVQARIDAHDRIELVRQPVTDPEISDDTPWIIATGPLTSPALQVRIRDLTGDEGLYFYDAIAPTVTLESLDQDILYRAARYDRGEADYLNAPMTETEYLRFHAEIMAADKIEIADFDHLELFSGCMPIEEIAASGEKSLAFGPMRPVGLLDPRSGHRPHAVVQLRQENAAGTLYGLVGFQTRMKFGEQQRVLRLIPGLQRAEFVRFGQLHRNFYLDSPRQLNRDYSLKACRSWFFAGQVTGVEGYVESIASGLLCALQVAARLKDAALPPLPRTTLLSTLLETHLFDQTATRFTPMNVNFGLLPPLVEVRKGRRAKQERKAAYGRRSLSDLAAHLQEHGLHSLLALT